MIKITIDSEPYVDAEADFIERVKNAYGKSWHDFLLACVESLAEKLGVKA